jgi:eukaryotic-like serine/threonine-protein kinase
MAEVFLAKREGPGGFEKNLVLKRILPHLSASQRFTELFLKEARLAALIDHPNLVHVSNFGQIDGQYYLAMEYVDGFTVADLLSRVGSLTAGVACRIAVDLLGALQAIHTAKLVHRDVTSRNAMVTRDGAVKLLDFGIAVAREDEAFTAMGTKKYMAPEQRTGSQVDHRADLFGVGVILYELICGETPPGASDGQIAQPEEIPDPLWKSVARLLASSPESRPSSAREVQAELEIFLASRGLEGTRAHLADVIDQVAPLPLTPMRMLSRITQMTRMTGASASMEVKRPSKTPIAIASLVAIVAIAWFASRREDPPPPVVVHAEPPPPPPPPVAVTPTVAEEPPKKRKPPREKTGVGRLTIDTRPWTEVYLGKRRLGLTPVVGVKLPSGKHELTLKNGELGLTRRITVTIRPGKTTRIQRTL